MGIKVGEKDPKTGDCGGCNLQGNRHKNIEKDLVSGKKIRREIEKPVSQIELIYQDAFMMKDISIQNHKRTVPWRTAKKAELNFSCPEARSEKSSCTRCIFLPSSRSRSHPASRFTTSKKFLYSSSLSCCNLPQPFHSKFYSIWL